MKIVVEPTDKIAEQLSGASRARWRLDLIRHTAKAERSVDFTVVTGPASLEAMATAWLAIAGDNLYLQVTLLDEPGQYQHEESTPRAGAVLPAHAGYALGGRSVTPW